MSVYLSVCLFVHVPIDQTNDRTDMPIFYSDDSTRFQEGMGGYPHPKKKNHTNINFLLVLSSKSFMTKNRYSDIFSDHELVISKIELKLKRTGKDKKNQTI